MLRRWWTLSVMLYYFIWQMFLMTILGQCRVHWSFYKGVWKESHWRRWWYDWKIKPCWRWCKFKISEVLKTCRLSSPLWWEQWRPLYDRHQVYQVRQYLSFNILVVYHAIFAPSYLQRIWFLKEGSNNLPILPSPRGHLSPKVFNGTLTHMECMGCETF